MRTGSSRNLDSINRSFRKLNMLKDRNWSLRDVRKETYSSSHNFSGAYDS